MLIAKEVELFEAFRNIKRLEVFNTDTKEFEIMTDFIHSITAGESPRSYHCTTCLDKGSFIFIQTI